MKLFVLLAIFSVAAVQAGPPPVVTVKNGMIAGYEKVLEDGVSAYVYEGIPYGNFLKV